MPPLPAGQPARLPVATSLKTAADLADVLLRRGILRESDWAGTEEGGLIASLSSGVERWVNEELGGYGVEYLKIPLIVTDNLRNLSSISFYGWEDNASAHAHGYHPHPDGECRQYGAFGLEVDVCEIVVVGPRVADLNALHPGAGFAAFNVLESALSDFEVFTPTRVYDMLQNWYDEYDRDPDPETVGEGEGLGDDGEPLPGGESPPPAGGTDNDRDAGEDEDERPTMGQFRREVPEPFFKGHTPLDAVYEARRLAADPKDVTLLDDVIRLHQLSDESYRLGDELNGYGSLNHIQYAEEERVPPAALLTLLDGLEDRLFDDYTQMLPQGEHTHFCWLHAFDIDDLDAINRGVTALQMAVRVLALADRVLQGLSDCPARDHRDDTAVRTYEQKREDARMIARLHAEALDAERQATERVI